MKKCTLSILSLVGSIFLSNSALANEYADALNKLAAGPIKEWAHSEQVIAAIKEQNKKTEKLNQSKIDDMDKKWRAETDATARPMIEAVLGNALSGYLKSVKNDAAGLYTEIFVMDMKGLNVGQSDVTSDYWQGDEGKFQKTYGQGPGSILVDDVEFDDSSQTYQSQVSIAIVDPASNAVIGAVTVGVNVEELE